jgi:hypothetical protein
MIFGKRMLKMSKKLPVKYGAKINKVRAFCVRPAVCPAMLHFKFTGFRGKQSG